MCIRDREMIDATNVPWAPWTVIDAAHKEKAALAIMEAVSSAMEAALELSLIHISRGCIEY